MITRCLNRIGTLQLKSIPTIRHGGKSSFASKPKLKPTTTSKRKIKPTATSKRKIKPTATFKDELDNVRVLTPRYPSCKEPDSSSHINQILASDAVKHRIFRYTIGFGNGVKPTVVRFYNIKDKDGKVEIGSLSITFNFGHLISQNTDTLRQAASTLAGLLERWPHPLDFGTRSKDVLVGLALERTSSKISKIYPTIEFDPPKSIYWSTLNGIDPDSGESYFVFVGVRPKNITSFEVPETPTTERFAFRETSRFQSQTIKDAPSKSAPMSPISDEDTSDEGRKHKAAIKVLQLVLWKYHSKILRLSDVQYAIEEIVLKYAARTQGSRGPYDGKLLYQLFSYRKGEYEFRPSHAVTRDTFHMLPSITLVGSHAPGVIHVGDTIVSTWTSTGDLKKAWLAGWETAQTVNKEAKAARKHTIDKDWADWNFINKPLNIRTLSR